MALTQAKLSRDEARCAREAVAMIHDEGGSITFDDYDRLASDRRVPFCAPINWIDGWGSVSLRRRNNAIKAVHAACLMGLAAQTDVGYVLTETGHGEPITS